jgi:indole-3-glycerol phosphate synthase
MRTKIPSDCLLVGESGVHSREDVQLLEQAGVNAILVGERLMVQKDVRAAVKQLLGT